MELALRQVQEMRLTQAQVLFAQTLELGDEEIGRWIEEMVRHNPALAPVLDIGEDQAKRWRQGPPVDDMPATGEEDAGEETLADELIAQVRLARAPSEVIATAVVIIGNLDDRGFLAMPLDELAAEVEVPVAVARRAQQLVQAQDPPGCGSRSVEEYLLFMVRHTWPEDDTFVELVTHHLGHLGRGRYDLVARKLGLDAEDVEEYHRMLKEEIDPTPARGRASGGRGFVQPSMTVYRGADTGLWRVKMDDDPRLKVKVDPKFLAETQAMPAGPAREERMRQLREAQSTLRMLEERHSLVKQIADLAVARQRRWFDGAEALRPLEIRTVARLLHRDASTISRALAGRYYRFDGQIGSLRSLFVAPAAGRTDSTVGHVHGALQALIAEEDPTAPLSDDALAARLADRGLRVSRRAIQKYRVELQIPSSRDRLVRNRQR